MTKRINTVWTRHIQDTDRRKMFEKHLLNNHDLLALMRLKQIVTERLTELDVRENALTAYDNPSWAYRQAHFNGARSELTKLRDLLEFIKD